MNNALFIIDPDGSQINCGYVRAVERSIHDDSYLRAESDNYGNVDLVPVRGLKSEEYSFSLHCDERQATYLHERFFACEQDNFKVVTQAKGDLKFSGYIKNLNWTMPNNCMFSVDLQIQVSGRVTCESIRDINKMTNFEILEFLHRRLALDTNAN